MMEQRDKGGRPRVVKNPKTLHVLVEDNVARALKHIAIDRDVLPAFIYREALTQYAERHATQQQ